MRHGGLCITDGEGFCCDRDDYFPDLSGLGRGRGARLCDPEAGGDPEAFQELPSLERFVTWTSGGRVKGMLSGDDGLEVSWDSITGLDSSLKGEMGGGEGELSMRES
jgi:hypothetical protein